jgi:hypothetical protein
VGVADLPGAVCGRDGGSRRLGAHVDEVHRTERHQGAQRDAGADRVVAHGHDHRADDHDADDLGRGHTPALEVDLVAESVVHRHRDERRVEREDERHQQLFCYHVDHLPGDLREVD